MLPGFLPFSRASFMMDFVATAMLIITPLLLFSVYALAKRRRYAAHRRVQMVMGFVLLIAVIFFELEVRLIGWRQLAQPSPYYDSILFPTLYVHLLCSISTTILWVWCLSGAHKAWGEQLKDHQQRGKTLPGLYSKKHRQLGWATVVMTCATTVSGWVFYWMAFVA